MAQKFLDSVPSSEGREARRDRERERERDGKGRKTEIKEGRKKKYLHKKLW